MIIRKEIDFAEPLTAEQLAMLEKVEACPAQPDENCPELAADQLARRINTKEDFK